MSQEAFPWSCYRPQEIGHRRQWPCLLGLRKGCGLSCQLRATQTLPSFFFFFNVLFIYLWLCWVFVATQAFSSSGEWRTGLSLPWLLLLQSTGSRAHELQSWCVGFIIAAPGLYGMGSVLVVYGLCCSAASGISLDQGSNLCLLH